MKRNKSAGEWPPSEPAVAREQSSNQTANQPSAALCLGARVIKAQGFCALALLALITMPLKAGIIATSSTEFAGVQGQNRWTYGYRDVPAEGASENYDPDWDFIPFAGGEGKGDWNGTTQQWTGAGWKTPDASEITSTGSGLGAPTRWTIRRWEATELTEKGPVSLKWSIAKSDISCGNGVTGSLYINGQLADKSTIAFDRSATLTRTYYALLTPGDRVDFALQSLGVDGRNDSQCDLTLMSLIINTTIAPEPKQPNGKLFLTDLPTPQLQVLSQTRTSNRGATLKWRSQASATYGIDASDDLMNWTRIKTDLPGGSTTASWSEELAGAVPPSRFYRVVEQSKSIEGLWVGYYDNRYYELVRIKLDGDQAVGTKLIGDTIVPAGKITWEASVASGVGRLQASHDYGFASPYWIAATLKIVSPDRLTLSMPSVNLVLPFRRVD